MPETNSPTPPAGSPDEDGRHAGLLLVGHGSASQAGAGATVRQQAAALRRSGGFTSVACGFLAGQPTAAAALATIDTPLVHILPYFMSPGYFSQVAVPRALNLTGPLTVRPAARVAGGVQTLHYLPPLGSHPGLADIGCRLALRFCRDAELAPTDCALLVIGHGSTQAPHSAQATRAFTERLAAAGAFATVTAALLEQPPSPQTALQRLTARHVLVLGFFAAAGLHGGLDLPAFVAAADAARTGGCRVHSLGSLGADPAIPALVLDLIRRVQAGERLNG